MMTLADLTNPVLRGVRSGGLTIEEALDVIALSEYWNSLPDPASHDPEFNNRQLAQARRVLLRRQARLNADNLRTQSSERGES